MSSEAVFQTILVLVFQKQTLPFILNRGILELDVFIQTNRNLTFKVQKKWNLELKQLWFGFCKIQTTFPHPLLPIARLKPQSEN